MASIPLSRLCPQDILRLNEAVARPAPPRTAVEVPRPPPPSLLPTTCPPDHPLIDPSLPPYPYRPLFTKGL